MLGLKTCSTRFFSTTPIKVMEYLKGTAVGNFPKVKVVPEPKEVELKSPLFNELFSPGLKNLQSIFARYNYEIRIAGGAVRDLLMDIKPHDIDLATTATPNEMCDMFTKEEVRMILNENALAHGTVTCRLDEENFEVTTLRIDKITDGRRAEVEFTKNWGIDASRRDFTVNSMFLDFNGNVIDYFTGIEDIGNREVRFVGNAVDRIQEDYLRILRYFRFFAKISNPSSKHNPETLKTISDNLKGLDNIAGERLWMELTQILHGNLMVETIKTIHEVGVLKCIGFPDSVDIDLFEKKFTSTNHLDAHHMTFVAALLENMKDLENLLKRVKFSKKEREVAGFIILFRGSCRGDKIKFYKDIIIDNHRLVDVKSTVCELIKYEGHVEALNEIMNWEVPKLPVHGTSLKNVGLKGRIIGDYLKLLREEWKKSNFELSENELLNKALQWKKEDNKKKS